VKDISLDNVAISI